MVAEIILLSCAWEIYVFNYCLFSDWPQQELWGPLPCPHLNPPCPPTWFLVPRTTQVVKNLPVTQATRLQSLGREDPLEKEMAIHSSTLAWRIHGQRSLAGYSLWGRKELDTTEWLTTYTHTSLVCIVTVKPAPIKTLWWKWIAELGLALAAVRFLIFTNLHLISSLLGPSMWRGGFGAGHCCGETINQHYWLSS